MEALYALTLIIFIIGLGTTIFIMRMIYIREIRLKKISEKISDGYAILKKNGKITNFNTAFLDLINASDKEIKNKVINKVLYYSNLEKKVKDRLIELVDNIEKNIDKETDIKVDDKILKITFKRLVENNVFMRYVILVKDVTENYKVRNDIKVNQEMLESRERFETLGSLVTGMVHSLNSPIFTMAGDVEVLNDLIDEYNASIGDKSVLSSDHKEIATEMQDWIEKIKDETGTLSDTITAIRDQVVTLSSNEKTEFTIENLVEYINILLENTLKEKLILINYTYKVEKETLIKGNFNSLVQVINNLIMNAIDSYEDKPNNVIDVVIKRSGKNLIISVIDTGKPIPDEVKPKIFKEIIYNNKKEKTGISLFVSYSNIKAEYGGDMTFSSDENKTEFNIIIPV